MNLYKSTDVDNFISMYIAKGGKSYRINEGSLTYSDWILFDITGELKCCIIRDVYLNEWSFAQSIRMYQKTLKNTRG